MSDFDFFSLDSNRVTMVIGYCICSLKIQGLHVLATTCGHFKGVAGIVYYTTVPVNCNSAHVTLSSLTLYHLNLKNGLVHLSSGTVPFNSFRGYG